MKSPSKNRQRQHGATLTGYALVLATFTSVALGTLNTLEDTSGKYLTDTGQVIAEPLEGREYLATSILENPPEWAVPTYTTTTAPTTTTTSTTVAPSSSSTASTTPGSSSTTPTTAATTYPSGAQIFTGTIGTNVPGMCLEVVGSQLKQVTCSGNAAPMKINKRPDGYVTVSMASGSCFGTESNSSAAAIKNQTCTEADNQLWTLIPSWNGTVQFQNKVTGFCMDVSGNSTSSGADIIQWADGNGNCKSTTSNNNHNFPLTSSTPPSTTTTTAAPTTTTAAPTTTTTAPPAILEVNAASATLSGGMVLNNGAIWVPENAGNNFNGPSGTNATATFTFTVSQAGTYKIQGNGLTNGGGSDSFYVVVDGQPSNGYTWRVSDGLSYVSDGNGSGPDVSVTLQPGSHTVTIFLREDGTKLSSLKLVKQ